MKQFQHWVFVISCVLMVQCGDRSDPVSPEPTFASDQSDLQIDPATGIPYAITFQHPITGFDTSDYGFGFGASNSYFCLSRNTSGQCTGYGHHLGRDTVVQQTPVDKEVFAPADGIVRVSTEMMFGAFGSDHTKNTAYKGCVIVLEHLLKNGQAVTTLLGHVQCESGVGYSADARTGNPAVGTVVRRGQYLAHVGHYWHGSQQSTDWHHLHWAMRKGRFSKTGEGPNGVLPYVRGYAPRSEFKADPVTGALAHPQWLDPFEVVAANGDPLAQASAQVRFHPSGSLLQDDEGGLWTVTDGAIIRSIPSSVFVADRYDSADVIGISNEELGCYSRGSTVPSLGHVTLYVRPGSNAVVMAYDQSWDRYDVIRWEALLSWGYDDGDLIDQAGAPYYESSYHPRGFRMLRPGTLVKADEAPEVSIVTAEQKRLPIVSGEVFEQAGFRWERVVSIPKSVLDTVAGPRIATPLTLTDLHRCAVKPGCPGGSVSCGGGGIPDCEPGSFQSCWCSAGDLGMQECSDDGLHIFRARAHRPLPKREVRMIPWRRFQIAFPERSSNAPA